MKRRCFRGPAGACMGVLAWMIVLSLSSAPCLAISPSGDKQLPVRPAGPVRLSPDGSTVLLLQRGAERGVYCYGIIGVDGTGHRAVFTSAVDWDDLFTACFGRGIWSPDGRRFAALTTDGKGFVRDDGKGLRRDRGKMRMVICDLEGKTVPLPCELGETYGAVFDANGLVYYVDLPSVDKKGPFMCLLRRYDPATKQTETLQEFDEHRLLGLTLSPDRKRMAAFACDSNLVSGDVARIWCYDLLSGRQAYSPPLYPDDFYYDGFPWLSWASDGKNVVTNGSLVKQEGVFSVLIFEPFISGPSGKSEVLRELQKNATMMTVCELAPGKLQVFCRKERKAFVLDVASDSLIPFSPDLILLDRMGDNCVFGDRKLRKLFTGKIVAANTPQMVKDKANPKTDLRPEN